MHALRSRAVAGLMSGFLVFGGGALTACDPEDNRDLREGVNEAEDAAEDAADEAEKAGKKLENEVDKADTDGKDD